MELFMLCVAGLVILCVAAAILNGLGL
jgi:hypothetical protein